MGEMTLEFDGTPLHNMYRSPQIDGYVGRLTIVIGWTWQLWIRAEFGALISTGR